MWCDSSKVWVFYSGLKGYVLRSHSRMLLTVSMNGELLISSCNGGFWLVEGLLFVFSAINHFHAFLLAPFVGLEYFLRKTKEN